MDRTVEHNSDVKHHEKVRYGTSVEERVTCADERDADPEDVAFAPYPRRFKEYAGQNGIDHVVLSNHSQIRARTALVGGITENVAR